MSDFERPLRPKGVTPRSVIGETTFSPLIPASVSLFLELLVTPRRSVEYGTLVAATLLVSNESSFSARGVSIAVPIPAETEYVEGSLFHESLRLTDASPFFEDGYELRDLGPGARTAFLWKLRVESGEEPIRIVPQVWAGETRVRGSDPIVIPRSASVTLYRLVDSVTLRYFERAFRPENKPTFLHHALLSCALACALDSDGRDVARLKLHLDLQAQLLHRLALQAQPIESNDGDAGRLFADLSALRLRVGSSPSFFSIRGKLGLQAQLAETTLEMLRRIASERERWDFLRARELTLILQAQTLSSEASPDQTAAVERGLRRYSQVTASVLERFKGISQQQGMSGLFFRSEPQLDAAARELLECVGQLPQQ